MTAPRIEIDLAKVEANASNLVQRLAVHGIAVTGVTKAALGCPEVSAALLQAGVSALGDSRIENLETIGLNESTAPRHLIRSPMVSQADRVVRIADLSFNTELDVIRALSCAAMRAKRTHDILLMVELGDLREGILPSDVPAVVREVLHFPGIQLRGIGANLACCSGVVPDDGNMAELSALADAIEAEFDVELGIVSGGNSGNLRWALSGSATGRINDLRLGESILLGRDPLDRLPIEGLHTDAFTLVAEVIESKRKPARPRGTIAQAAFGAPPSGFGREGVMWRTLFALGEQDTDPHGLTPPPGIKFLAASGDHFVAESEFRQTVGSETTFHPNYSSLVRAMTSPFVAKLLIAESRDRPLAHVGLSSPSLPRC